MSSKSSGFRVKRSLSFGAQEKLPYDGKTFYIDVKSSSVKSKISQRVLNLGGRIENFLSKDLSLLITDKQENGNKANQENHSTPSQALKNSKPIPLSRGQALLLKASGQTSPSVCNNGNGLVQSATKLGVEIQTVTAFLHSSSRLLMKVKKSAQKSKQEDPLCGMSPISWDEDKENLCVIKVEDEDSLFRPLFKQFEKFPEICYSECGSPFDVGVVLTKQNENNQAKKKAVSGRVQLGGYCESCDHWYKCSLREHLSSTKHKQFIAETENFTSLNEVTSNLPNLSIFVYNHGLKLKHDNTNLGSDQGEMKPTVSDNCTTNDSTNIEVENKLAVKTESSMLKTGPPVSCHLNDNSEIMNCNRQSQIQSLLPKDLVYKSVNRSNSCENQSEISKPCIHSRNSQRFTLDDVLSSVVDDDNDEELDNVHIINNIKAKIDMPSDFSGIIDTNHQIIETRASKNSLQKIEHVSDKKDFQTFFTPDANFSSSSFSFGDTGVNNVLTMLNDNESHNSQSVTSERSNSSTRNLKQSNSSAVASGYEIPIIDSVKNLQENGDFTVCLKNDVESIGTVPSCQNELQEDINIGRSQETTSGVTDDLTVADKKSVIGYQFPEYSNITEESNQSKPLIHKTIPSEVPNLDFHCLDFDTNLFGKDDNSMTGTPDKKHMDALRAKIHEKKANTGSTIRNWLVPMDDLNALVDSPTGLGTSFTTLVDKSVNGAYAEAHVDKEKVNVKQANVKNIEETTDTSKVAEWIQNNIFNGETGEVGTNIENCVVNGRNEIDPTCADIYLNDEKLKPIDDIGMDESCSVRKYSSVHSVGEDSNSVWSESGTSISDCTLPDFRKNLSQETANPPTVSKSNSITNHSTTEEKNIESIGCVNVRARSSSLSSSVTSRGIKITGLSTLKTESDNLSISTRCLDTLPVCYTTDETIADVKRTNSDLFGSVKQEVPHNDSVKTPQNFSNTTHHFGQSATNTSVPAPMVQSMAQTVYRPIAPIPAHQTIPLQATQPTHSQKSSAKSKPVKNTKAKKKSTPANQSRKGKKGAAVKNDLQTQSPYIEPYNNFTQNQTASPHTNSMLNQHFYPHGNQQQSMLKQYGFNLNSPSNMIQLNKTGQPYPQMQPCIATAYSPYSQGTGMMDFLLSPGSQHSSAAVQTQVHSPHLQQQQQHYHQSPHHGVCHPPNTQLNTKNSESNQVANQQHKQYQSNNAHPHFLSQNSNFLAFGYQHQQPSPKISNFAPQSTGLLSPGSSNQGGQFQTIDVSHIAESNSNDYSAMFNIARPKQTNTQTKCKSQSSQKQTSNNTTNTTNRNVFETMSAQYSNISTNSPVMNSPVTRPTAQNSPVNSYSQGNQLSQKSQNGVPYVSSHNMSAYLTNGVPTSNTMHHGYAQNQGQTRYLQNSQSGNNSSQVYNSHPTGYSNSQPVYDFQPNSYGFSQQMNNLQQTGFGHNQAFYNAQPTGYDKPQTVYNTVKTGDMKLTFRKIPSSNTVVEQSKPDLMHYWNVRKAGDCRLVFSANVLGKRKAEETPSKSQFINDSADSDSGNQQQSKRRRCLIY